MAHELVPIEWVAHLDETEKTADAEIRKASEFVVKLNAIGSLVPNYQAGVFRVLDGQEVLAQIKATGGTTHTGK